MPSQSLDVAAVFNDLSVAPPGTHDPLVEGGSVLASKEEQNGTNFSSVATSSEELGVCKGI